MICSPCFALSSLLAICSWPIGGLAQSTPVFHPTILNPNGTDVWTVGQVATVRWSNHGLDIPPDKHGQILLGYTAPALITTVVWYDQPLADGFLVSDQVVNVIVPDVPSGNFYFIQLSGDVSNSTQDTPFTINNPASPPKPLSAAINLEPSTLSISSAPPATASHFLGSSAGSSVTATTTPMPSFSASPSSTSDTPSSSSTSGAPQNKWNGSFWTFVVFISVIVIVS